MPFRRRRVVVRRKLSVALLSSSSSSSSNADSANAVYVIKRRVRRHKPLKRRS